MQPGDLERAPVRQMEWSMEQGRVLLSYPDALTQDDVDDIEQLFALTVRMMRRRLADAIERADHAAI